MSSCCRAVLVGLCGGLAMSPDEMQQESHLAGSFLMASCLLSGPSRCLLSGPCRQSHVVVLGQGAAEEMHGCSTTGVGGKLAVPRTCSSRGAAGTSKQV